VPPRFKFHAAGREDVDVRMLGPGRPYAIELVDSKPCALPLAALLRLHRGVNERAGGLLVSTVLSPGSRDEFMRLSKGADSKRKTYSALVWSSAPHSAARIAQLLDARVPAGAGLELLQRTPVRVLHRRSLLERRRRVFAMRTEWLAPHFFVLHLVTSAGTYVKEFVHGDLGRTRPSVGELLSEGAASGAGAGEGAAAGAGAVAGASGERPASTLVAADILLLDVTDLVMESSGGAGDEEEDESGDEVD